MPYSNEECKKELKPNPNELKKVMQPHNPLITLALNETNQKEAKGILSLNVNCRWYA